MRPKDRWPEERSRALDEVRELVLGALCAADAGVYLVGSCARGEATSLSDIDIAIEPKAGFPEDLIGAIRERLAESTIPYTVDVVDLGSADPEFRARLLRNAVAWRA